MCLDNDTWTGRCTLHTENAIPFDLGRCRAHKIHYEYMNNFADPCVHVLHMSSSRQALLTRQLPANATLGGSNSKTQGIKSDLPGEEVPTVMVTPTPPSVAQAREVIDPLERALQIYTEMHNAQQAAACHYQVIRVRNT